MKTIISLLFVLCLTVHAQTIIPKPVSHTAGEGSFTLKSGTFIYAKMNKVNFYTQHLFSNTGINLKMAPADVSCTVQFLSGEMRGKEARGKKLPEGAYELRVVSACANIYADSDSGHFYGLQSLIQLLKSGEKKQQDITIPCCVIKDTPRFGWRGFMLDESRHFSGVNNVKKLLDAMAYYKLNRFHWHLTDSPGWRIEIKKYPKLTTVGAIGNHTDKNAPAEFYTQEQIKEIVAYAKARHITIIPEIDMPG
ncbi:MAG: family 20 glycosylhydrolase, partial [Akkermansiaceae bacterium]